MKTKILFFLYSLSGGGAERTIVNIINNLDREKYEVILVLGTNKNNDYKNFLRKDIKIKVLDCKKLRYSLFKLRKYILSENPDILFSTINANNIILLLAKILSFKKIPTIVREASNRTESGKVTALNKIITSLIYNLFANKVIALSEGVKNDLINNFYVKKSKIQVIYNPIEVDNIIKMSEEKIKDFQRNQNEKIVIAVGRLVEAKNYSTLLRAFDFVAKNINARLIILGKGPLEGKLKKMCQELGISNKVNFMGFRTNPYKFMKEADLFVLSSKWEGFGHVIVEAMCVGTPVISTNCNSGPEEIIKNNVYGVLVPVGDPKALSEKIIELLMNTDLHKHYSKQGQRRAKDFKAINITKQYEREFEKVL